jgi:hypothetical protein
MACRTAVRGPLAEGICQKDQAVEDLSEGRGTIPRSPEKTEEDEPLVPIEELRIEGSQKEFTLQGIEKICAELCGDRS